MAAVAVVIPTYNNLPELRQCLEALDQQTYKDFVAYVCVDGSTDGTWTYLEKYRPAFVEALTHPDGKNHGRSAARNLALSFLSKHTWVAFLDSDSVPTPGWLEAFLAAGPQPNEVLLGHTLYFAAENPHIWTAYLRWREGRRGMASPPQPRHFTTANAFLASQLLLQAGGLDKQLRRYGMEDTELGYSLARFGTTFRYVRAASVWKFVSVEVEQALVLLYEAARYNLPYLYAKYPHARQELFGGRWLTQRWRQWLLTPFLLPFWARSALSYLPVAPPFLQKWLVRYLVFYALGRGYWRKHLKLPLVQRLRPSP
ncbi:MAG: glycosyltransferase [Bacteroidia bacterium]|nr:glycosyltransferase [Bacteroidia bacterium]MDW8089618.1 glycosyltransferase [Bacteroidia bacterium]